MIHIIGYRDLDENGKRSKTVKFLNNNWYAASVIDLFSNIDRHLSVIPKEEQFNLHYTLGDTSNRKTRQYNFLDVLAFDIDGIDASRVNDYVTVVSRVIKFPSGGTIIFSGHGLHFIVHLLESISPKEIDGLKPYYYAVCKRINKELKALNMVGLADTGAFKDTGTLRLPNTMNIKPDKEPVACYFLRATWEKSYYNLKDMVNAEELPVTKQTSDIIKVYPKPDTKGVLEGCPFLVWCGKHQEEVKENQWYAALSIIARLSDGRELCHKFSQEHPNYNHNETELKIDQALMAAGPRTCSNINILWEGCEACKHFSEGKIPSPIVIESPDYIKTKEDGFYNVSTKVVIKDDGSKEIVKTRGKPNYEDLRREFEREYEYRTLGDGKICYIFDGTVWKSLSDAWIEGYAQDKFNPKATTSMCLEFKNLIYRTNLVQEEWFNPSCKINLRNGVLDLNTMQLLPHSHEYGFTYRLDYDYVPDAVCPDFDAFLADITLNRKDLEDILMEFAGYSISNMPCHYDKSLIMYGEGCNGKSTFTDTLKLLVGNNNYTALTMDDLDKEVNRHVLMNKLFNISEETPKKSFLDGSMFKNLSAGGTTLVRMLYKPPMFYTNKTKLILSCNTLPVSGDQTSGMFRRLLIIPFDACFEGREDKFMVDKLEKELPGILNRVIKGYKRLISQENFTDSLTVKKAVNAYRESTDTTLAWFNENVTVTNNNDDFIPSEELYGAYQRWARPLNLYVENYNNFCKRVGKHIGREPTRKRAGAKQIRGFVGMTTEGGAF